MIETYYDVLGISPAATADDIKSAYRELVKQYHPDAMPGVSNAVRRLAEERFKDIGEAYQVLSSQRSQYDTALRAQRPQQTPQPQAAQTPSAPLRTIPRFNSVPLAAKFTGIIVAAILSPLLVALFPWSAFFVSICIFGLLFLLWAENKAIKHKEGFKWVAAATALLLVMSFVVGVATNEVASAAHQEHAAVTPGAYKCADGNLHPEPCHDPFGTNTQPASQLHPDLAILRNGYFIRHERRETLRTVTRLYTAAGSYVDVSTDQIDHFEKDFSIPPPTTKRENPKNLDEIINTISDRHHLDPDLINSVIAESGFNPRAVSPKGAQGLMQLMPQTASQLGVRNAFDPHDNVEGGTAYLRQLLEQYNFDLIKALAAYHVGPHRVEQYRGVPPDYETRAYVARVVRDFNRKKIAEQNFLGGTKLPGIKASPQP